jgi:1-acyl-sn-glycerol-3-phosphate acyltransferase
VSWGEPIPFGRGTDRKRATAQAEAEVRHALRPQSVGARSAPRVLARTTGELAAP